jgi:ribosomal protein S27AE
MTHCPHCGDEIEVPDGDMIRLDEFFEEDAEDVDVSVQQHVQLECPECGAVLGYLGVGAATGG